MLLAPGVSTQINALRKRSFALLPHSIVVRLCTLQGFPLDFLQSFYSDNLGETVAKLEHLLRG